MHERKVINLCCLVLSDLAFALRGWSPLHSRKESLPGYSILLYLAGDDN